MDIKAKQVLINAKVTNKAKNGQHFYKNEVGKIIMISDPALPYERMIKDMGYNDTKELLNDFEILKALKLKAQKKGYKNIREAEFKPANKIGAERLLNKLKGGIE